MSTVYDINSFLATLQGNANILQNKITSLNTEISNLSSQPQSSIQREYINNIGSIDYGDRTVTQDSKGQYYREVLGPSDAANTISADKTQLPGLQTQLDQLNSQIKAAQNIASTIPRTTPTNPTVSSPGLNLSSLKLPNLSNVSPVLLVAGIGLLILILK